MTNFRALPDGAVHPYNIRSYDDKPDFEIQQVAEAVAASRRSFPQTMLSLRDPDFLLLEERELGTIADPIAKRIKELKRLSSSESIGIVLSVVTPRSVPPQDFNPKVRRFLKVPFTRSAGSEQTNRSALADFKKDNDYAFYELHDSTRLFKDLDECTIVDAQLHQKFRSRLLAKINKAFNAWVTRPENLEELRSCAEGLVTRRRNRTYYSAKWERFATGCRFTCPVSRCNQIHFTDRHLFGKHIKIDHPELDNLSVIGQDDFCKQSWSYRDAPNTKRMDQRAWISGERKDPHKQMSSGPPKSSLAQGARNVSNPSEAIDQEASMLPENPATSEPQKKGLRSEVPRHRSSVTNGNSIEVDGLAATDLFVQNPRSYFDTLRSLRNQVHGLGKKYLGDIVQEGTDHYLRFPVVLDDKAPADFPPCLRPLLERNLNLLGATLEGLEILKQAQLCHQAFNLVVLDSRRVDVVRVVSINRPTLEVLRDLVEEALSYCSPRYHLELFTEAITDINASIVRILKHLSLPTASFDQYEYVRDETCIGVGKILSSTSAVLFLGLVSFIKAHLAEMCTDAIPFSRLCIESVDNDVIMAPRRLTCLESFTKNPIWTFGSRSCMTELQSGTKDLEQRYSLSILIADLADLWGPINIQYAGDDDKEAVELRMGGGVVRRVEGGPNIPRIDDEITCHWCSWMEVGPKSDSGGSLPTTKRLLIGTSTGYTGKPQSSYPEPAITCKSASYALRFQAFELKTRVSSWKLDAKTAQISAGHYASVMCGRTWRFDVG